MPGKIQAQRTAFLRETIRAVNARATAERRKIGASGTIIPFVGSCRPSRPQQPVEAVEEARTAARWSRRRDAITAKLVGLMQGSRVIEQSVDGS